MANPDKLNSQINFKEIDAAQITKALSEYQNSFFKLILIAVSLLLAWMMFNDCHAKEQILRNKMSKVKQKLEVIKAREAAIKDFADFKALLPKKINESGLIEVISNYAKAHHASIASLSPAESKDMGLYDFMNLTFNGTCENFREMMLLLRNIEKSEYPLRIDSWKASEQGGEISFAMVISAVIIHT